MSKILNNIKEQLTGKRYPQQRSLVEVTKEIKELEFNYLYEYSIKAEFGSVVRCERKDLNRAIENVYNSLKNEIYGEFIQRVLELERAIYAQERDKCYMLIRDILREIT